MGHKHSKTSKKEQFNDELMPDKNGPAPIAKESTYNPEENDSDNSNETEEKRQLLLNLVKNDISYKKYFPNFIKNLSQEAIQHLFNADSKYNNYEIDDLKKKLFLSLIGKIDNYQEFLNIWINDKKYKEENYFKYCLQIWNNYFKVSELKDFSEEEWCTKLEKNNIEYSKMPTDMKSDFRNAVYQSEGITEISNDIIYFIEQQYKDFDDLIKSNLKCKKAIEDSKELEEDSICKGILKRNIDISILKIINDFFPLYKKKMESEYNNIKEDIKQEQIKIAKNKLSTIAKMPDTKIKTIINDVFKKYKENKFTG